MGGEGGRKGAFERLKPEDDRGKMELQESLQEVLSCSNRARREAAKDWAKSRAQRGYPRGPSTGLSKVAASVGGKR